MSEIELQEWIRENLVVDSHYVDSWGDNNNQTVGLRFVGEEKAFTYLSLSIPKETN